MNAPPDDRNDDARVAPGARRDTGKQASRKRSTFVVECRKSTGAWNAFNTYSTREEAHAVANRLRELGAATRVVAGGAS